MDKIWTKTFGYRPSSKRPRIDCINTSDAHPKDPESQNSSVFQKSEKKWKKIAKTLFFLNIFRKLKSFFITLNNITSCLIHNIVRRSNLSHKSLLH